MRRTKLVVSAFLGTLMYVFVSIFFGPEGLDAMMQLEQQQRQISMNLVKLQGINTALSYDFLALRSDPDIVAAYAKNLGYIKNHNERLVRLVGFPENRNFTVESGFAIALVEVKSMSEKECKMLGIAFALLAFVALQFNGFSMLKPKKKAAGNISSPR